MKLKAKVKINNQVRDDLEINKLKVKSSKNNNLDILNSST